MQNMASNRFIQVLLSVVVVLQLWIAIKPAVYAIPVKAAGSVVRYKVVQAYDRNEPTDPATVEQRLNDVGKDGWTLVTCTIDAQCIFKN